MKIVSPKTSLVVHLFTGKYIFMIRIKTEGEGVIIVKGKRPNAIWQMVNSQVSIFEQDKVQHDTNYF